MSRLIKIYILFTIAIAACVESRANTCFGTLQVTLDSSYNFGSASGVSGAYLNCRLKQTFWWGYKEWYGGNFANLQLFDSSHNLIISDSCGGVACVIRDVSGATIAIDGMSPGISTSMLVTPEVLALQAIGNNVYVGGYFTSAGGTTGNHNFAEVNSATGHDNTGGTWQTSDQTWAGGYSGAYVSFLSIDSGTLIVDGNGLDTWGDYSGWIGTSNGRARYTPSGSSGTWSTAP